MNKRRFVLRLKKEVDGVKLWQRLFEFADQSSDQSRSTGEVKSGALAIIHSYMN